VDQKYNCMVVVPPGRHVQLLLSVAVIE